MKTTITSNDALENRLRRCANEHSLKFKQALNNHPSVGLEHTKRSEAPKSYQTESKKAGLKKGFNYDQVAELLEQAEGSHYQ